MLRVLCPYVAISISIHNNVCRRVAVSPDEAASLLSLDTYTTTPTTATSPACTPLPHPATHTYTYSHCTIRHAPIALSPTDDWEALN